jgi:hypothetical protein
MYCFSRIKPSHAGTSGDAGSTGRNRHACGSVLNLWNHPVKTSVFRLDQIDDAGINSFV